MTKHYPLLTTLFIAFTLSATAQDLPRNAVQVLGGYSKHGSGDMNGIVFGAEYVRYTSKRFSLNYNFRATINDGIDRIIETNVSAGTVRDASVRFTTAGVQLGTDAGFSFIRTRSHEALASLGGFVRYQSASNGDDGYALYYPSATGLPMTVVAYNNHTPQETFNAGGILQLRYNYTFNNKIVAGLSAGFQTDSNGDAIQQLGITIGKRF